MPAPSAADGALVGILKSLHTERSLHPEEVAGECCDPCEIDSVLRTKCLPLRLVERSGRGWRLAQPIEWLEERAVRAHCSGVDVHLTLVDETGSTQDEVEQRLHLLGRHEFVAVCAEHQRAGRGRQGRSWTNVIGSDVLMSIGFEQTAEASAAAGIGLAVGVALRDAFPQARLKWPNDLIAADGAKIGGVLCRAKRVGGRLQIVVGIGVNVHNPAGADRKAGRKVASLRDVGFRGGRNEACGRAIACVAGRVRQFALQGLSGMRDEWLEGALAKPGDRIGYRSGGGGIESGIFRGIGDSGELLAEAADGIRRIYSADIEDADSLH